LGGEKSSPFFYVLLGFLNILIFIDVISYNWLINKNEQATNTSDTSN
jgi:high-affinity nickel permease